MTSPETTSPKIKSKTQKLDQSPLVHLYELDLTPLGDDILRFCSSVKETDVVKFGGHNYEPRAIEVSGFEVSGDGPSPEPMVKISNLDNQIGMAIAGYGDLVGMKFTRIRTFREFLDDEMDPDDTATFPSEQYLIEQKTTQNSLFVEWKLSSALDQEGKLLPGRQVLRDVCTWQYRRYDEDAGYFAYENATCPYTGGTYFDETGASTANKNEDRCSKQLSACRARFGNSALPFSGFPAVAKVR